MLSPGNSIFFKLKIWNTKSIFLKCYRNYRCSLRYCATSNISYFSVYCYVFRQCFFQVYLNYQSQIERMCLSSVKHHRYVLKPTIKSKKKELCHDDLMNILEKSKSVSEQIDTFYSSVKLQSSDIEHRYSICKDLENTLKPYFPSCFVKCIGSSVNNFGLKGCDLDLSIQFSSLEDKLDNKEVENAAFTENLKNSIYKGKNWLDLPPKQQLLVIQKILLSENYTEPLTLIPGRCPILNFYYKDVSCDLAVKNGSAFCGTNLMLLCGKLDSRVAPLMQVLSYWAKKSKMIGGPIKLKSYALFLLLLYYLQTRSPAVLPSAKYFMEKTDFLRNAENWSYDITSCVDAFETSVNTQTLDELLRGFFFFYANFDFSYIICPIIGKAIQKDAFDFKTNSHFELNAINIQDPLNLGWNVTTEVNFKYCKLFLKCLIVACEKYQNEDIWVSGQKKWGLAALLCNDQSTFSHSIKDFSLQIPLISKSDNNGFQFSILESSKEILKKIFETCLLFHCSTVNTDADLSASNLSVKNSELLVSTLKCVSNNAWLGRSAFTECYKNSWEVLETEKRISEQIVQSKKNTIKETTHFTCDVFYLPGNNALLLKCKPLSSDKFVPKFVVFLKDYIPKMYNRLCSCS